MDADNSHDHSDYTCDPWSEVKGHVKVTYIALIGTPNEAPYEPSNPSPANGATGVSTTTDLSWTGGDPNGDDTVTYDVYLGTSPTSLSLVCSDISSTTCDPGTLNKNTTYYWKVVAEDEFGLTTESDVWSFTSMGDDKITIDSPDNGSRPAIHKDDRGYYIFMDGTVTVGKDTSPGCFVKVYSPSDQFLGEWCTDRTLSAAKSYAFTIRAYVDNANVTLTGENTLRVYWMRGDPREVSTTVTVNLPADYSEVVCGYVGDIPVCLSPEDIEALKAMKAEGERQMQRDDITEDTLRVVSDFVSNIDLLLQLENNPGARITSKATKVLTVLQAMHETAETGGGWGDVVARSLSSFFNLGEVPILSEILAAGWEYLYVPIRTWVSGPMDTWERIGLLQPIGFMEAGVEATGEYLPANYYRHWQVGPFLPLVGNVSGIIVKLEYVYMGPGDYFTIYDRTLYPLWNSTPGIRHENMERTIPTEFGYVIVDCDDSGADSYGFKFDPEGYIFLKCHSARYYNQDDHATKLVKNGIEAVPINFSWGSGSPYPEVNGDYFTVVWSGQINISANDTYTFYVESENGTVNLRIDNNTLFSNYVFDDLAEANSSIYLNESWHDFAIYYHHTTGSASFKLSWENSTMSKQVVPDENMRTGETKLASLPLTAFFSYEVPESGNNVSFTDLSFGDNITEWEWDFGDGTVETYNRSVNPFHNYGATGFYNVSLTVTNSTGGTSTYSEVINVTPDLTIPDLGISTSNQHAGVFVYVENIGEYDAGSFYVKLEVKDGGSVIWSQEKSVSGLSAGSTTTVYFSIDFSNSEAKTYEFHAIADSHNDVSEINEGNNERTASATVPGPSPPPPPPSGVEAGCGASTRYHGKLSSGTVMFFVSPLRRYGVPYAETTFYIPNNPPHNLKIKHAVIYIVIMGDADPFIRGDGKGGFFNIGIINAGGYFRLPPVGYGHDMYQACDPASTWECVPIVADKRCTALSSTPEELPDFVSGPLCRYEYCIDNLGWNQLCCDSIEEGKDCRYNNGISVRDQVAGNNIHFITVDLGPNPWITTGYNTISVSVKPCSGCCRGGWDGEVTAIAMVVVAEDLSGTMPTVTYWINDGVIHTETTDFDRVDKNYYGTSYVWFNTTSDKLPQTPLRYKLFLFGPPFVFAGRHITGHSDDLNFFVISNTAVSDWWSNNLWQGHDRDVVYVDGGRVEIWDDSEFDHAILVDKLLDPSDPYSFYPGTHNYLYGYCYEQPAYHFASAQVLAIIGDCPVANFTYSPKDPIAGQLIQFNDTSYDTEPGVNITSWYWEFGDGTNSTEQNPLHTYTSPGRYKVKLKIKTDAGGSDEITKEIFVGLANLNIDTDKHPSNITNDIYTINAEASNNTVKVEFYINETLKRNDTDSSDGWSCEINLKDYINKTVKVKAIAYDNGGRNTTDEEEFKVYLYGDMDGDGYVTMGDVMKLYNYVTGSLNISVPWEVGDVNGDTALTRYDVKVLFDGVMHNSLPAGKYFLFVNKTRVSRYENPPYANFTYSPENPTALDTIQFTDLSTGNITSWYWEFDDGSTSTEQNSSHKYNSAKTYMVSLTVTDNNNVKDMYWTNVQVEEPTPSVVDYYASYGWNNVENILEKGDQYAYALSDGYAYITVDTAKSANSGNITVKTYIGSCEGPECDWGYKTATVYGSIDGSTWTELGSFAIPIEGSPEEYTVSFSGMDVRYVKVYLSIAECGLEWYIDSIELG